MQGMNKMPDEAMNETTGMPFRNPTRIEITDDASSQQEVVDALRGAIDFGYDEYHYDDPSNQQPLSGILNVREMNEKALGGFFKTLFRARPNITKIHFKLGEYPNKRKLTNGKVSALNGNIKRLYTELGERVADLFSDRSNNIVEFKYTVSKNPERFFTTFEVWTANDKDYKDNDKFNPAIGIEYFSMA
jgi:hypothetical protein